MAYWSSVEDSFDLHHPLPDERNKSIVKRQIIFNTDIFIILLPDG